MDGSSGMHAVSQGYIFIILIYGALKMCCVFDIKKNPLYNNNKYFI